MNEIFICVILGISLVIVVTMLKMRESDPLPTMMYGYYECGACGKVLIHKMLLHHGEVLQADCLACSIGEERYNVLNGVLIEHTELENKRRIEMITSWAEEED